MSRHNDMNEVLRWVQFLSTDLQCNNAIVKFNKMYNVYIYCMNSLLHVMSSAWIWQSKTFIIFLISLLSVWMETSWSSLNWPSLIGLWGWGRLHTYCTSCTSHLPCRWCQSRTTAIGLGTAEISAVSRLHHPRPVSSPTATAGWTGGVL